MNKIESLKSLILEDTSIGIDLINEINAWDNSLEYLQVYQMDEFDGLLEGYEPLEIANRIFYGNFDPNHEFFRFNGYANLESLGEYDLRDEIIDSASEIARRTVELYEDGHLPYLNDEILEILDKEENL